MELSKKWELPQHRKKLFFNLKRIKNQIAPLNEKSLKPEHINEISKRLDVKNEEVVSMNNRMQANDKSLNSQISNEEEGGSEWQDWIVDDSLDQELELSQKQELEGRRKLMNNSINILNKREKDILNARRLSEKISTLDELSKKYGISRERIRQIETKAFEKLQRAMLKHIKIEQLVN